MARAKAVRVGRDLGRELSPGELTLGSSKFPVTIGSVRFFKRMRAGGGGFNQFRNMTVTVRREHIPADFVFESGAQGTVTNLLLNKSWTLKIGSGSDMLGREENIEDTTGNVVLAMVGPDSEA